MASAALAPTPGAGTVNPGALGTEGSRPVPPAAAAAARGDSCCLPEPTLGAPKPAPPSPAVIPARALPTPTENDDDDPLTGLEAAPVRATSPPTGGNSDPEPRALRGSTTVELDEASFAVWGSSGVPTLLETSETGGSTVIARWACNARICAWKASVSVGRRDGGIDVRLDLRIDAGLRRGQKRSREIMGGGEGSR